MGSLDKRFPVYSRLLKLYPAPYRKRYVDPMLQTLADMLDDPAQHKSGVWARTILDLPLSLAKENLFYTGEVMTNETPSYVKRNILIETVLLLPFFGLIIINSLFNHALDFANSWKGLFMWLVIGLPLAALLLGVATYIQWSTQQKHGLWKNILDLRQNWLIFSVTGLAFLIVIFVPFHDSTQCIAGNPIKELRNPHQTWSCIQDPPYGNH